jgi:hypothetical protein
VRAALRRIPEETFLTEAEPQYAPARMLEQIVPPDGRVFSFSPVAEAYTSRSVVVGYQSARAVRLREILWTPLIPDLQQLRVQEFRFLERQTERLRLLQTATHPRDTWSVTELRVFRGERELPRDARWRLRANPNPWDVQRAFDNSDITRWSSHTPLRPGCFVEIDFGKSETVDRVVVQSTRDQYQARLAVEVAGKSGLWTRVGGEPADVASSTRVRTGRRAAADELKREGITHIVVETNDFKSEDFYMRAEHWGLELAGERGGHRLYKLK